ncbi:MULTISPECIES: DNA mismatch repair protein MutS [unclassified Synechococcus]|uniref:DNA mismatch repair protein MutS n=1 Tax=unclassified Synechococcus TaxID=2626047 RepID=UPI0020CFB6AA|nr:MULTISPECIES: DNA mismatch repair protein MutS [unclassified Synechococcus]
MTEEAQTQLSLIASAAVQGSLFGPSEPSAAPGSEASTLNSVSAAPAGTELDDEALIAEATARPRRRQARTADPKADGTAPVAEAEESAESGEPADALPPWHHHSLVDPEALPPVLRHYVELKAAHPERVLLYRLGDFFECFFEDAIRVSRLLELTLTGKEGGKRIGRVPMAGIPHHAAERYCGELVRRGLAVALCDQLESTPAPGALLRRGITRVLTPGTVLEEGMLAARRNNWLAAVVLEQGQWGLAVADVSTGEFQLMQRQGSDQLHQDLLQLQPAELLWPSAEPSDEPSGPAWAPESIHRTPLPLTPFTLPEARRTLLERFELASLEGLGLGEAPLALRAAGGLVRYLDDTQPATDEPAEATAIASTSRNTLGQIPLDLPTLLQRSDQLVLDAQTRRNLEITQTQRDGQFQGSLLWALDRTMTAMGARALRRWLEAPLMDIKAIEARQEGIGVLVQQRPLRLALRRLLRPMGDLERLAGRAGAGSASARDLVALADGLERLPRLAALLESVDATVFGPLQQRDPQLAQLAALVRHTLVVAPPLSLNDGGLIHDGVDSRLDGLRNRLDDQDQWLAAQEQGERQRSGIPALRLQFHRSFGYFLSVSRARAERVPEHWIRRQTLANEERFVTPELKAREGRILQLRARAAQREYELFSQLRQHVGELAGPIRQAARRVAGLDALASLAEVAATQGYCRPQLEHSRCLQVEAGRHPVVEQLLVEESFSANDLHLGEEGRPDLVVLTGPNASGKSCYLRQNGLLQLMAQIGSWIPARSARMGLADRIFTRVGAVDDLATGQSTFMVEMAETANILHHATDRSLVLLDEIGRGTATFDGLSIAWAVAEHLAAGLRARAVFATHYHELNELASLLPGVANYQVLVEETGDHLLFLHQVRPGGASRSYGIEAARLAGVPPQVVQRARQVLGRIEANSHVAVGLQAAA